MILNSNDSLDVLQKIRTDPWEFLTRCVFTKDQVSQSEPVKRFPAEWPYLKLYTRLWQQEKLMAVPKSRRMFMSWCNIGLYLWATLFYPGQDFAFVSKKEEDAGELIKKAEFIYDNIPANVIPREALPKKDVHKKPASIMFPEIDSKIQGYPMGADQLRQFTFSGILGDECAFWEVAQQFFSGAAPTILGGGRMTLISSRSPGFFQRLVYDQFDNQDDIDESNTPPQQFPFKDDSVIIWRNPKNEFLIFDLHYTANPNKRDPAFKEKVKASMPIKDYLVEYERAWTAYDGKPVFEDYNKFRHESAIKQEAHLGLPLLIGVDFGLTPAAVVAQLREGRLIILKEFVAENSGIKRFSQHVLQQLAVLFPEWRDAKKDFRWFIDPAGLQRAQTDERTCAQEMMSQGIRSIFPGPIDWETRRKSVEYFLIQFTNDGPGLVLCPKDCPVLSKAFAGAYRYPEKYLVIQPDKPMPIKDRSSHVSDATQYLCSGALALLGKGRSLKEIPIPAYSITQNHGVA